MSVVGTDIVKRIDDLLGLRGEKRQNLADALGFSVANIAKWKHYGSLPNSDSALAIADYLGVSVRWLLSGEDDQGLTLEERNLLAKYSRLDQRGRFEVNALLDAKLDGNISGIDREKETFA
jgi:transcriptional regulator with XRE-family HTH domain